MVQPPLPYPATRKLDPRADRDAVEVRKDELLDSTTQSRLLRSDTFGSQHLLDSVERIEEGTPDDGDATRKAAWPEADVVRVGSGDCGHTR